MDDNVLSLELKELEFGVEEAVKSLRTNLIYSGEVQTVAVTSTGAGEGKSAIAMHLARSFAELGKRTILIDCDLRKSMMASRYGFHSNIAGLSELLSGQSKKVVYSTNIPDLYIVPAGKTAPNPQELLASSRFNSFVETMKKNCDYIIFDTPPIGGMADAIIVGQQADGMLLVVRNDYVKKSVLRSVKRQIQQNGGRVLGVVLNRVKKSQKGYYKKYGYGYGYDK